MIAGGAISIPGGTATLGAGFVPTQLSGLVLWLRADLGITLGSTLLLTGTSPAPVTITGSASPTPGLRLTIDLGGARGVATFKASADNGASFFATGILTAASVPLTGPLTGITVAFPVGTYVLNDTYDGTVSQWNDQSGQANHVANPTAASQPIFSAPLAAYNNAASVSFLIARSTFLTKANTNLFGTGPYTMALAHRQLSTANSYSFGNTNSTGGTGGAALGTNGTSRTVLHQNVAAHTDAATQTSTPEIWVATYDGSTVPVFYVNGVATTVTGTNGMLTPAAAGAIAVGAFVFGVTPSNFASADLIEGVIYNTLASPGQAIALSRYMAAKIGVPA